jgi:hypothetical protein
MVLMDNQDNIGYNQFKDILYYNEINYRFNNIVFMLNPSKNLYPNRYEDFK